LSSSQWIITIYVYCNLAIRRPRTQTAYPRRGHTIRKLAFHCVRTLGFTRTRRQTSWLWYREDGEPVSSPWLPGLPTVGTAQWKILLKKAHRETSFIRCCSSVVDLDTN
jgi:hypothetical protein